MSTTTGPRDHGAYGAPPAPLDRRVAASLLDGVLTSVCAAPLLAAVLPAWLAGVRAAAGTGSTTPAGPSPVLLVVGTVLLAAWGGVQWWCHGTRGWTLGRRVLGLRTVDVRSGRPIGLGRALVRSLVVAAGVLACGIGQLLVLLSPLFDPARRRGWHDRVSDAVVVDVRGLATVRRIAVPAGARAPVPAVGPRVAAPGAEDPAPAGGAPRAASGPSGAPVAPDASTAPAPAPARAGAWPAAVDGVPHQASPEPGLSPDLELSPVAGRVAVPEPLPEPPVPTRTRWTTLAAGRQLDAPDLLLPALGGPGLGPDLDTRQLPAVLPVQPTGTPGTAPAPTDLTGPPRTTPVPEGGGHGAGPGPRPAWTPPPTPDPGSRVPDPLDLAVPWVPAAEREAEASPTPRAAWWHGRTDPAPATRPAASPATPPAAPPATPPAARSASAAPPPATPHPGAFPDRGPAAGPTSASAGASAWTVRLPDGSVLGLDTPLLVGRDPAPVPGAHPVAVADPGRSVSKTHLMLGLDEHGPWVVDRGSTNGTLVTLGDGQRIVCLADRRVRLTDGSLVTFGDLSLSVRVRA